MSSEFTEITVATGFSWPRVSCPCRACGRGAVARFKLRRPFFRSLKGTLILSKLPRSLRLPRLRAVRRLRGRRILRPVVLRIPPSHLLRDVVVRVRPERLQIRRHLHRSPRRRQQVHLHRDRLIRARPRRLRHPEQLLQPRPQHRRPAGRAVIHRKLAPARDHDVRRARRFNSPRRFVIHHAPKQPVAVELSKQEDDTKQIRDRETATSTHSSTEAPSSSSLSFSFSHQQLLLIHPQDQ